MANDPSQQNDPATTDPTGPATQAATAPARALTTRHSTRRRSPSRASGRAAQRLDLLHFIGQSDEGIGTTKAVYPDGWIASILESIRGISGDA